MTLHFSPEGGGETLSFTWTDPEGDGAPVVDAIPLPDRTNHGHHDTKTYNLDVELWNALESPPVDVGADVEDAADEYQLFFTGSAVEGPATGTNTGAVIAHNYADSDSGGLPLGLSNTVDTLAWGSGELIVTLRHMASEDGAPVKVVDLAEDVADNGFDAIGGETDLQVTFDIEVE